MPRSPQSPEGDSARALDLSDFDLRFERYRIIQPKPELLMARSLAKYSQLAPVVYCELEGALVLVDGFKRLRAARTLKAMTTLQARLLEVDEQAGYRVRYETSASLIEVLNQARAIKALPSRVRKYCSYDLLIIDEFGFESSRFGFD